MKENALAGGVSGIVARLVTTPLDVVKIRFQLQEETINRRDVSSKYTGITQTLRTIAQEEGIQALWKGNVPGLAMYFLYGGLQFSTFELTNRTMKEKLHVQSSAWVNFLSGCVGGFTAVCFCHPLDVIRTRLVCQGRERHYASLASAIRLMYLENGLRTFYKGLVPSLLLIVPQAGLHFGCYTFFLATWQQSSRQCSPASSSNGPLQGNTGMESLVCGGLAGLTSKTITLPLDIVKKRLQVQGFEVARQQFGQATRLTGVFDAFGKIFIHEGVTGFYKGATPGMLKTIIGTSLSFYVYEYTLQWLRDS